MAGAASGAVKASAIDAIGGGPEDPVADIAAGAELAHSVKGSSSSQGSTLGQRALARVSTPSDAAQTVTKIIWAVALGLIVLEIASEATGQFWSFSLPTSGTPLNKQPYQPLYQGQTLNNSPMPFNAVAPPSVGPIPGGPMLAP